MRTLAQDSREITTPPELRETYAKPPFAPAHVSAAVVAGFSRTKIGCVALVVDRAASAVDPRAGPLPPQAEAGAWRAHMAHCLQKLPVADFRREDLAMTSHISVRGSVIAALLLAAGCMSGGNGENKNDLQ
jgi:hypothetical protein